MTSCYERLVTGCQPRQHSPLLFFERERVPAGNECDYSDIALSKLTALHRLVRRCSGVRTSKRIPLPECSASSTRAQQSQQLGQQFHYPSALNGVAEAWMSPADLQQVLLQRTAFVVCPASPPIEDTSPAHIYSIFPALSAPPSYSGHSVPTD